MALSMVIPGSAPARTPMTRPVTIIAKFRGSKVFNKPLPRRANWSNMKDFSLFTR
jgi:hypothetical protein